MYMYLYSLSKEEKFRINRKIFLNSYFLMELSY